MTMIAALVLMVGCETKPVEQTPTPPPPPPPVEEPPKTEPEETEPSSDVSYSLPIGDGPTEFRVGNDLVGLGFRAMVDGKDTEYVYMFQAPVAAGGDADWDTGTDTIQKWPSGCTPEQLTLTPSPCLTAVPLKVFTASGEGVLCVKDGQGNYPDVCPRLDDANFRANIQSNIGQRIKRADYTFPNNLIKTAKTIITSGVAWAPAQKLACEKLNGATDPERNDAYHIGENRVWQHMLTSGDSRIARVVHFNSGLQSVPPPLIHVRDWPSGSGDPPSLGAWCNQVDTWCANKTGQCYYAEMNITYQ